MTGKYLCRKGPEGPDKQEVECESAVGFHNDEAQLLPS